MRILVALSALALLAACGQQQPANEPEAPVVTGPVMPDWASEYVGRAVSEAWPNGNRNCQGGISAATVEGAATRVTGWAWDRSTNTAYSRLISVGADGIINGAGSTTADRPDVVARVPGVTTPRVGFEIVTNSASGTLRIAALDTATNTACWVGEITY